MIVDVQENRSFDHNYGFAPFASSYGVPAGYTQPDGNGGLVAPHHLASLSTTDIGHTWTAMHGVYYNLFQSSTLCVNYFCSILGPTYPNRFYLAAGTSGGITTNGVWGYGVLDYPIILDLLEEAGVTGRSTTSVSTA